MKRNGFIGDLQKECEDVYLAEQDDTVSAEPEEEEIEEEEDYEELFDVKALMKEPQKRWCFCHPDCFANQGYVCGVLSDTRFSGSFCGGCCPFYKNKEQFIADRKKAMDLLAESGKLGLAYKYAKCLEDWELTYLEKLAERIGEFTQAALEDLADLVNMRSDIMELIAETEDLEEKAEKIVKASGKPIDVKQEESRYKEEEADLFDDEGQEE